MKKLIIGLAFCFLLCSSNTALAKNLSDVIQSSNTSDKKNLIVDYSQNTLSIDGKKSTLEDELNISNRSSKKTIHNKAKELGYELVSSDSTTETYENIFCNMRLFVRDLKENNSEKVYTLLDYSVLQYKSVEDTKSAYEELIQKGYEVVIDRNIEMTLSSLPDQEEPFSYGVNLMNMDVMQNQSAISNSVVAVIDSGVNETLFPGRILEGIDYTNSGTMEDQIQNGGHGNKVTSIIVESTNKYVSVLPLKTFDQNGKTKVSWIAAALEAAIEKADVINMSLGYEGDDAATKTFWSSLIDEAIQKNIPVVVAAGNNPVSTSKNYPACYKPCWTIGSIDMNMNYVSSAYGILDFACPGYDVTALASTGIQQNVNGTSFATPHLSAMAAQYKTMFHYKNIDILYEILKSSCLDLGDEGYDVFFGYGLPQYSIGHENPCLEEHTWIESNTTEGTCISKDSVTYICSICDAIKIEEGQTNPNKHNSIITESKESTCIKKGFKKTLCKDCHKVLSYTELKQTNHTFNHLQDTTEEGSVTNTSVEIQTYSNQKCSICNKIESKLKSTNIIYAPQKAKITSSKKLGTRKIKTKIVQQTNCYYELQCSLNKKYSKIYKKKSSKNATITLSSLKKKKTYYIRARAYRTVGNHILYGKWSTIKRVKLK